MPSSASRLHAVDDMTIGRPGASISRDVACRMVSIWSCGLRVSNENENAPFTVKGLISNQVQVFKPQLQILTLWVSIPRDIEAPSRPISISSTACGRDAGIGIAIFPIRSVSPLKHGPNDIAIFPSRDWSV